MQTKDHFNEIAGRYDTEIPEHIRLHLLKKKTDAMLRLIERAPSLARKGLDCGCGTGHYLARLTKAGYDMSGFEYSPGMLAQAKMNNPGIENNLGLGSITDIPHADETFDFSYTINVLHHLPSKDAQVTAVNEMLRVTRSGGIVFLQDFDADNILARAYMDYIFPLTSKIDDDETEIWVSPKEFKKIGFENASVKHIDRFTLLPNVTPKIAFGLLRTVEAGMERLVSRKFGAHFMMALEKT